MRSPQFGPGLGFYPGLSLTLEEMLPPSVCVSLQVLQIAMDVASAMAYLHPKVVHRDLKSQVSGTPACSCLLTGKHALPCLWTAAHDSKPGKHSS